MIFLLAAAFALPAVFWNKGPETADLLRKAGIHQICVPPDRAAAWNSVAGIQAESQNPAALISLPTPSLTYRRHVAAATAAPWVNSNGWRLVRQPDAHFFYNAPGPSAALAAAEAFAFHVQAAIQTDDAGLQPLGKMIAFLRRLPSSPATQPQVNIGYIDDGSPESGEFMNLLVRKNLLFEPEKTADAQLLNVALGQSDYPKSEAGNPLLLAEKVRGNLTDEKRLLRIYGSDTVIGRLYSDGKSARLILLNYSSPKGAVEGLRVRVLGSYSKIEAAQFGNPAAKLIDVATSAQAAEFTLPELKTLAIIDLAP